MTTIFVSYSREDSRWVREMPGQPHGEVPFVPWLGRQLRDLGVELWCDPELGNMPGEAYEKVICDVIDRSDFALLLLSHDFVVSDFIRRVELPRIRQRVEAGQLQMIPILVAPINWQWNEESQWLLNRQVIPGKPTPLINYLKDDAAWRQVRMEIAGIVRDRVKAQKKGAGEASTAIPGPIPHAPDLEHEPRVEDRGSEALWKNPEPAAAKSASHPPPFSEPRPNPATTGAARSGLNTASVPPPRAKTDLVEKPKAPPTNKAAKQPSGVKLGAKLALSALWQRFCALPLRERLKWIFATYLSMAVLCVVIGATRESLGQLGFTGDFTGETRIDNTSVRAEIGSKEQITSTEPSATSDRELGDLTNQEIENQYWDTTRNRLLHTLHGHTLPVMSASFSRDGTLVVTGSADQTACIWDAQTGEFLHTLEGHTSTIDSALFSPDGTVVATASDDGTARIWDTETGNPLHILQGHSDSVYSAQFSPDGRLVLTASADNTARIWNVESGGTEYILSGHSDTIRCAVFSPDGQTIATASFDDSARIWDSQTGNHLQTLIGHEAGVRMVSFSSDGRLIVTAGLDGTARLWNPQSGKLLHTLYGHSAIVFSSSFSPDDRQIITTSDDGTVRLWNTQTSALISTFTGHNSEYHNIFATFSPDGSRIVTAPIDKVACIWDVQTGRFLQSFPYQSMETSSLAFSTDGRRIVTGYWNGTTRIWDATP